LHKSFKILNWQGFPGRVAGLCLDRRPGQIRKKLKSWDFLPPVKTVAADLAEIAESRCNQRLHTHHKNQNQNKKAAKGKSFQQKWGKVVNCGKSYLLLPLNWS
jgi:hypothetical protein